MPGMNASPLVPLRTAALACALFVLGLGASTAAQSALDEARGLRKSGKPAEAVATLDAALQRTPGDADMQGLLGLCLLDAGDMTRARSLAEQLKDYQGDAFRPYVFVGRVYQQGQQVEPAIAAYRRAVKVNPRCIEALNQLVVLYIGAGNFGKALKQAEKLTAVRPEVGRPMMAAALAAQGDQQRRAGGETITLAADSFLAALEYLPDDRPLGERALDTLVIAVRLAEAEQVAEQVFPERGPGGSRSNDWHAWMGTIRAAAMDGVAAREHFETALAGQPDHPRAALGLARLLVDDGDFEAARGLLDVIRAHDPDSGRTALLLGEVLVALGETDEGIAALERAVELDPVQPKGHYQLARALLQAGRRDEGRAAMDRFRELQEASAPEVVR